MSTILIIIFIILLPFCPVWINIRDTITHNWNIRHASLWVIILYRIKVKNSYEKLHVLKYKTVKELYKYHITE